MTGAQGAECRVSRSATGSVTILDLTRDGGPVEPALGSARTYRDFFASIAESLVTVAPGGSLDVALPADPGPPPALVTYAADGRGGASTVRWPLDRRRRRGLHRGRGSRRRGHRDDHADAAALTAARR